MKKLYLFLVIVLVMLLHSNTSAQCRPQIANMAITQPGAPVQDGSKCQYTFSFSFDIITNGGFKYLFFHSWLANDYPSTPIFDCTSSSAQSPGTSLQLGTNVDDPGKSFLDMGFLNLNSASFPANTHVDVTSNFATVYEHDPSVILTQPLNSPNLQAFITRKNNSDTLHFDITNIRVIINSACGLPILGKTDVWGSNGNPPDPKAQCYLCGLTHSFNDPQISLFKSCDTSPFKYQVGLTSLYPDSDPIHVTYGVYLHDPLEGDLPLFTDPLIYTSPVIPLSENNPYSSGLVSLPHPFCCVDPWAQYNMYVRVKAQEFSNIFQSRVIEIRCAALPISLKSFSANRGGSEVKLKWITVSEDNNRGFDLQRKTGNGEWESIGFVQSKAVSGNSSVVLSYEFTDINSTKGVSQYRLKQIDFDGRFGFSEIRSVRGDGQKSNIIIYPNPSRDGNLNIVFDDAGGLRNVSLIDLNGRMIRQWKGISNNTLQINNLVTGLYTVRIINTETGEQDIEKIVVKNR